MRGDTERYYAARAPEYDRIYAAPRWQPDLAVLRALVAESFAGRSVLEVACGTGYWTEQAATVAASVHAEDLNPETLALARARCGRIATVTFACADAYGPAPAAAPARPRFDGGLAGFWLSHVDRARMAEFLRAFHGRLAPGSPVVMFDEQPREPRGVPTSRDDAAGNRYEARTLLTGARFEIIKNWLDEATLEALLSGYAGNLVYRALEHLWVVRYRVRRAAPVRRGGRDSRPGGTR